MLKPVRPAPDPAERHVAEPHTPLRLEQLGIREKDERSSVRAKGLCEA